MMKQIFTLITLLCCVVFTRAQTDNPPVEKDTLFENAPLGMVRFYFDDHYYLVDKDCEFKSIERLSAFIVKKNVFDGEFKDFNPRGKIILTGNYKEGIKEGLFTAYHDNGATKWTCTFKDDKPTGDWNYYYPDGKPMLTVSYDSTSVKLMNFWNRFGQQKVIEGKGTYELMMPFEFYNEFGYPYFIRKGRIKNGLPVGYWPTTATDNKRDSQLFSEEVFNDQGIMTDGYNLFTGKSMEIPFSILPTDHFQTAERIMYKACTFDAYSGFDSYLGDKFNTMSKRREKIDSTQYGSVHIFSFEVTVDKDGMPNAIKQTKTVNNDELNTWITRMIKEIPYYFPTLDSEGKPVEDRVSVAGVLSIDETGSPNFHSFNVER